MKSVVRIIGIALFLLPLVSAEPVQAQTMLCPQDVTFSIPALPGDTLTVALVLTNGPLSMDAAGVDVAFNDTDLTFERFMQSAYTASWGPGNFFGTLPPGVTDTVRVGGCCVPMPLMTAATDTLGYLLFTVNATMPGTSSITTTNFVADLSGLLDCTGTITFEQRGDGDVTEDTFLTPRDALCTHQSFMMMMLEPECTDERAGDVDCDGMNEEGDAQAIFARYLCGGAPEDCFAAMGGPGPCPTTLPVDQAATRAVTELRVLDTPVDSNGRAAVSLVVAGSGTFDAFALDLAIPVGYDLVGFERSTETQAWAAVDVNDIGTAFRVGGFDSPGVQLSLEGTLLGSILLQAESVPSATVSLEVIQTFDDLEGATISTGNLLATHAPLAGSFSLFHAEPNPFGDSVRLRFSVATQELLDAQLQIVDVTGRTVRTLVQGATSAGTQEVTWDGRDDVGRTVAAGVYFARLTSGEKVQTQKLLFMK